ncbi:MAG: glycosyltransferase, partial [Flavobacterium sp.]
TIDTIYYPLNPDDFNTIDKQVAKKSLKLPLNKVIIGFACEDLKNPRKGFATLLKALSLLSKNEREHVCCLTFGKENREIDQIHDLEIIQLGTINNIKIQSLVYSAMDFFIIPSTAEAFGLTCLEAMFCKTPVLGANVGGIPEMVIDQHSGFLFDSTDHFSMKNGILRVLNTTHVERAQMGENSRNLVLSNHNPDTISKLYVGLYKGVLND